MSDLEIESEELLDTIPSRDEYYFHDGSCVIQAGNSLFRVHKSLLERDSQIFRTLFSLPQNQAQSTSEVKPTKPETLREGDSDENPIIFQDSVDDFRALCWALYAKPGEIVGQQAWSTVDIPRLIRVAAISHKYEIEYFRDWSLDLINMHFNANPRELIFRCGLWLHIDRIMNLSRECQRWALAGLIEEEWLRTIETSGADTSLSAFEAALNLAERSPDLRRFHGKVYYAYLKAIGAFLAGPAIEPGVEMTEFVNHGPKSLNRMRSKRLRRGFWSLVQLQLRLSVPPKTNGDSCVNHAAKCLPGWDGWWKLRLGSISPPTCDPSEVLLQMQGKLISESGHSSTLQYTYANPNTYYGGSSTLTSYVYCINQVKQQIQEMITLFHDSLPDHFMIPK